MFDEQQEYPLSFRLLDTAAEKQRLRTKTRVEPPLLEVLLLDYVTG